MNRLMFLLSFLWALPGCLFAGSNGIGISYDVDPQEFVQDLGGQQGSLPSVDCSASASLCTALPLPQGVSAACDGTKQCAATIDINLSQTINLSTQTNFPSQVASSSLISGVNIKAVRYWTPTNTLTFDLPSVDIYIGPQTARYATDSGVAKLGTLPAIPAGTLSNCQVGAVAGTKAGACEIQLTSDGESLIARLAKDFKSPFNIIVTARATATGGQPVPAGKIDIFLQPQLTYQISL